MTLLDYIKKCNSEWDFMTETEQIALSICFAVKYMMVMPFFDKIDGQHWRQN